MIDTVRFRTPIDGNTKKLIESIGRRTESYDMSTGEIYYSFTNVNLKGSWETAIQLKVNEKVIIKGKQYYMLYVECSLHKLILGHNCYGGSDDLRKQLVYLQDILFKELYLHINLHEITITRIDYAYVWKLKNQQQSINFIHQLHKVPYRGKQPKEKYDTTAFWRTTNWSMKVYDKLSDFQVHDMKKSNFTEKFYKKLPGLLRFEVTFRKKKLEDIHKKKNLKLDDINILLLKEFADEKIQYIESYIGENNDYKRLNTFEKVMNELENSNQITKQMASRLLTSYTIINNIGLTGFKNMVSKATYHRHKSLLAEHGIDIVNGTIDLKTKYVQKLYPEDFKMSENKYKIESNDLDNYLMVAI